MCQNIKRELEVMRKQRDYLGGANEALRAEVRRLRRIVQRMKDEEATQ